MLVADYLKQVQATHKTGVATEHSYRPALKFLFDGLDPALTAVNEPKRVACGAPDFIINRRDIAIGFCEAKDLDVDLRQMKGANADQKKRYLKALPNLIYTNGLDFDFYRNAELISSISIGDYLMGIQPKPENFEALRNQLADFARQTPQTITSSKKLAEMMAGKAVLIKDILARSLIADKESETELKSQYEAFKTHLIHDIKMEDFADIYSETIAYGMFAARLHDETLSDFSREEALRLLPKSNPFLRSLFGYIAGQDLDDRIRWIVDDLAKVFQACDIAELLRDFGKFTQRNDPFLHFYETFLAAYNPKKRRARGVWYTPEPVVNFIVRAVDDVLKNEFGLPMGLADTSKVTIPWDTGQTDRKGKAIRTRKEVHRVQILDPATGTGTFLAEVVRQIAPRVKDAAAGMWSSYIEKDLIPRVHGFELLMASYAMCHLKLDMMLEQNGYVPSSTPPRISVYLTNSLEEGEAADQSLPFAQWLSNESKNANAIKRDMPIMCVIGNPPYSKASTNKSSWINGLIEDYKRDLDETSFNSLSDDYVKFLRFAEHLIVKNGHGILGMITNNSFVDGVVHRNMRKHLLKTFDNVWILNLHGDSNKLETAPNGAPDKNVFEIKQGVSIIIGCRSLTHDDNKCAVASADVFGSRETKYDFLWQESIAGDKFQRLEPTAPNHFLIPKNLSGQEVYEKGFRLDEIFVEMASGIKFRKDNLLVRRHFTPGSVVEMVSDVRGLSSEKLLAKYDFAETPDWRLEEQRRNFVDASPENICAITYRPLDNRFAYYPLETISKIIPRGDSRKALMSSMLHGPNIALLMGRQNKSGTVDHFFVTDKLSEMKAAERTIQSYHCPLYIYPSRDGLDLGRKVNLDEKIVARILEIVGSGGAQAPDELAIFDYIYGVLYAPSYRQTFLEFLKIGFPRIPYPRSAESFASIAERGGQLRKLHLLQSEAIGLTPYPFLGEGDNVVDRPSFHFGGGVYGRVRLNANQYFDVVPTDAWHYQIGGYLPAQKWLSDRAGRALSFEDVQHYQKLVKALSETARIEKTIEIPIA